MLIRVKDDDWRRFVQDNKDDPWGVWVIEFVENVTSVLTYRVISLLKSHDRERGVILDNF